MIDKNNFDQVSFDYFEGNLSLEDKSAVEQFVRENPSYQKDFQAWQNSYIEDENHQFKNIDSLLANEESAPRYWLKWGSSSLLLILLSFLSYAIYVEVNDTTAGSEKETSNGRGGKGKTQPNIAETTAAAETNSNSLSSINNEDVAVINYNSSSQKKNNALSEQTAKIKSKKEVAAGKTTANGSGTEGHNSSGASEKQYQFSELSINDKNIAQYSLAAGAMMPALFEDEMSQRGGIEVLNLGDPFVLYGGVSPIQENPSFAGNTDGIRIKYLVRSEWPELETKSFLTNTFSIDGYVNKVKGGVAILYTSDIMAGNRVNTNSFSFVYSPKIHIGKWSIEPSARYTLSSRTIDWSQLSAGDSFDPRTGTLFASTAFIPENAGTSHIMMNTFGAGILFNGKTIYGGFAVDNLFNPSYTDASFDQKVYIPMKFTAQMGTDIRKNSKSDWIYSPSISYRKQGLYNKLWMSNIVKYKNVIAGASFSTADAMLFSLGYSNSNLRLTYSYGMSGLPFSADPLSNQLFASHQVTMRYVIKQQAK